MTATLTFHTLSLIWLGAFIGALAAGAAGFAFALTASSIWLHVLDPIHTTVLVVACGSLLHIGLFWPMRRMIVPSRLAPFLVGGAVGLPFGALLLTRTDAGMLKLCLGLLLVVYGLYALAAPRLPVISGGGRKADALIGLVGGVMGGLGGYSGVAPTIWTQLRGWNKDAARGVYQPFVLFAHLGALALVGAFAFDRTSLVLILAALPMLLLGAWAGWLIFGRLDERLFRKVLATMLTASGLALLI